MSTSTDILGHPKGLFVCFATEMWERFSYYGMRALLILYLTKHWEFTDAKSYLIYGAYTSLVYIMPVFGGMLADRVLGSKKAVTFGAILLVLGHFGMAFEGQGGISTKELLFTPDVWNIAVYSINITREFLYEQIFFLSLALIISGVGFLKPNISTMVGALYKEGDPRRDSGFTIFYMGINIGAFTATLLCGYLGEEIGWAYGFGAAGIGMLLGLIIFLGGQRYLEGLAEPPSNEYKKSFYINNLKLPFTKETSSYILGVIMVIVAWFLVQNQEIVGSLLGVFGGICIAFWLGYSLMKCTPVERDRLLAVGVLILFSLIFWALFEQAGSSLNILTDRGIDRTIFSYSLYVPEVWNISVYSAGWEIPASMFQSLNAGFIFTLAPFFAILWVALAKRNIEPSTPMKFALGIIFVGLGFLVLVYGMNSSNGLQTGLIWIVMIYLLHTIGELFLSPVGLSSVTKLSPQRIVGMMMGMWFLASAAGNFVAGLIARATSSASSQVNASNEIPRPAILQETIETFTVAQKNGFVDVYLNVGLLAIGFGVLLAILTPLIKRLMHGTS